MHLMSLIQHSYINGISGKYLKNNTPREDHESEVVTDERPDHKSKPIKLADFVGSQDKDGIPYRLMDYLELVDWTGRAIIEGKTGYIDAKESKILEKLGFTTEVWLKSYHQYSDHLYSHIGSPEQLKAVCEQCDKKWLAGVRKSRQLYAS